MSEQYREMWRDLGLDLAAHDQLMAVLGQGYGQVFLTQPNRPRGMDYFNFVMSEVHGLRIKELLDGKKDGVKVVGSY
ncbi:MAG: 2-hydroxyacyl-CoA dehydratase, partial [Thermodesulfobacteriota bacterium]